MEIYGRENQNTRQTDEFSSFVEEFEREANDFMPAESEIVGLARRGGISLDAENLRESVVQHAHLLPKERADEFNALVLNAPFGTAKFRIGLLKPLSVDDKRRFARHLGIYSTSETVIKFQILDGMFFQILMSEAYEKRNIVRKQKRREEEQTRETIFWGGGDPLSLGTGTTAGASGGQTAANKAAEAQAQNEATSIEELAGQRFDISDLTSYYELKAKLDAKLIALDSLETLDFVRFLLQDFTLSGASDLHLHSRRGGGRIRYRSQGEPYLRFDGISTQRFQQIAYCLCTLGGKDPSKMKQLGVATVIKLKIQLDGVIKPVEFRFQSLPTLHNPSVILRGQAKPLRDINQCGFTQIQLGDILSAVSNDRGIVLVTGPTGSGKTNTLNCILAILEEGDRLGIIEIGAPIEIESPYRLQITMPETHSEAQNEVIRQKFFMDAMRSDPDVICYTEIRSVDESKTAFRAAVTGHLVLTTLHAADVEETFGRLFEMNIDRSIIAKGIVAIVSQTLVRKLCAHCKIVDDEATQLAGGGIIIYKANELGCGECDGGYKGRTVVAEVLYFNEGVQKLVTEGYQPGEIARTVVDNGWMQPMKIVARDKLNAGDTSEEEVKNLIELRTAVNFDAVEIPDVGNYDDEEKLPVQDADYIDVQAEPV